MGLRPIPRLSRLRGPLRPAPLPRRARAARRFSGAPPPYPGSVACGDPFAPRRFLAGRAPRADSPGRRPHTPAQSLAGTPSSRAASSQGARRAPILRGAAPYPGSVACGDPFAPRRSLAGRAPRADSPGRRPHTPAQSPLRADSTAATAPRSSDIGGCSGIA